MKQKIINNFLLGTNIILCLYYMIQFILDFDLPGILSSLFLIALSIVSYFFTFKKYNFNSFDSIISLSFILLSGILGSLVNLFNTLSYYDDIMHFLSGILVTYVAYELINYFEVKISIKFSILFALSFSAMIASLWEISEYVADLTLGIDSQKVGLYGINDTMKDIIFAHLGSVCFIAFKYKKRV